MTEESLFELALNTPESERAALLDRECGDAGLRARVEALLAAHKAPEPWLASPAEPTGPHQTPAEPQSPAACAGAVIANRYKLLQQIGEGGMGSVWMAEQTEPVKRRVAVKLIRAERGGSGAILARFEAERQAIALMDHPNVARLLDAGTTESGRPFFVMELVKGVPLSQFCDEHKLSVPDRLRLFVPICSAVQHAHQKGIIHRDLKPSNVLVESHDGRPVPKVIDFGLAKAAGGTQLTEKTLFTAFGSVMGTPLYMAPEQASFNAVDVDTRADVYALGCILYELLTGSTPLDRQAVRKAAFDEVLRLIREQEPPIPSSRISTSETKPAVAANRQTEAQKLGRFVKGELDWVVMKALSKERERRYESASAFAKDVERFLNHEPVAAGPPSAAYRLRKFVRRNRAAVTAAGLVLLALLLGMAAATAGLIEARRQASIARGEAEAKEQARQAEADRAESEAKAKAEAEANWQEAVRTLGFATKGNEILGSVFDGLDPNQIAESGRPLQDVLREQLHKAVKGLDGSAIGDELAVARMQDTLGRSLLALGDYGPAITLFEKALATRRGRLGPEHRDTVLSTTHLALAYVEAGKFDRAVPMLEGALRLEKARLGPEHLDTLGGMNHLAGAYRAAGRLDEALALYERAYRLRKDRLGPDHKETLVSMNDLALCCQEAGKPEKAVPLFDEGFRRSKARLGPEHPETITGMSNLGDACRDAGDLDRALPLLEEALRLSNAKLGPDHPMTLKCMNNLALCRRAVGDLGRALTLLEETLRLSKAKLGPDHPLTLKRTSNLALCHQDAGKYEKAVSLHEEALRLTKAKLGPDHPITIKGMNNLAAGYGAAGKWDEAVPLIEEMHRLSKSKLGPDHPDTIISMGNLGLGYLNVGKPDRAMPLLEEAWKLATVKLGPDHPKTLVGLNNLASGHWEAGDFDRAVPLLEEALRLSKAKLGPRHPDTLLRMSNLGAAHVKANHPEKGAPLLEEALALSRSQRGPDHPSTVTILINLTYVYQNAGKFDRSVPLLEDLVRIHRAKLGPDHPVTLDFMNRLGTAYWWTRRLDRSVPLFEETLALREKMLGRGHVETQATAANLGINYRDAGRFEEALPLLEEAYRSSGKLPQLRWVGPELLDAYLKAGRAAQARKLVDGQLAAARKQLPKDSPQLGALLAQYGLALLEARGYGEAEALLREALAIREKAAPDHWTTFNARSMLGGALLGQKKYAEAGPLLLAGYEGMKKREKTIPPQGYERIPEALDRLIELYRATKRPDEVKKYRAEREKYPNLLPPPLEER
jgi:tetratricopeptide (TPR) repeat protein